MRANIYTGLFTDGISSELPTSEDREGFILICHTGTARFNYFHREYSVRSRDIIILFPGDIYTLDHPSQNFNCSWVIFSAEVMEKVLHNIPSTFFSHIADSPVYNLDENSQYQNRMSYLTLLSQTQTQSENVSLSEIMHSLLRALFLEIYNRVVSKRSIAADEPKNRRRILDEFVTLVSATPRKREVAYFAERLCITPKYLSTVVADGTGFGAKEFIDRNAVETIKQMLRTTTLSVKQIAERLDYAGSGNLCRFFKSRTGQTISEWIETER